MSICSYCGFRIRKTNRIKFNGQWQHKLCPNEGIEHKKKITNELISKANAIFNKRSMILTGEGLTRTELRLLERRGRVKKSYRKYGDGTLRCVWMRPSTHEKLKVAEKKRRELEEAKEIKVNIFRRFWIFIKNLFGGGNEKVSERTVEKGKKSVAA